MEVSESKMIMVVNFSLSSTLLRRWKWKSERVSMKNISEVCSICLIPRGISLLLERTKRQFHSKNNPGPLSRPLPKTISMSTMSISLLRSIPSQEPELKFRKILNSIHKNGSCKLCAPSKMAGATSRRGLLPLTPTSEPSGKSLKFPIDALSPSCTQTIVK